MPPALTPYVERVRARVHRVPEPFRARLLAALQAVSAAEMEQILRGLVSVARSAAPAARVQLVDVVLARALGLLKVSLGAVERRSLARILLAILEDD